MPGFNQSLVHKTTPNSSCDYHHESVTAVACGCADSPAGSWIEPEWPFLIRINSELFCESLYSLDGLPSEWATVWVPLGGPKFS